MAIKITKTLYVGLGGTGVKSILRTKQCFVDAYGEVPPMVAFLAIDTDKAIRNEMRTSRNGSSVKLEDNEICFCGITGSALEIYREHQSQFQWVPQRNVRNLQNLANNGAGAIRSNGRFLARHNATSISNRVAGKVTQIAQPLPIDCKFEYNTNKDGVEYPVIVNIVGSVAGGTGSGTILDILILVAKTLRNSGLQYSITPWIVLPEVFRFMAPGPTSANVFQNAYGALRELDYLYHLDRTNQLPLDFEFDKVNYLDENIGDTYLINNTNRSGVTFQNVDDIADSIGRCMFLPSNESDSVMDNTGHVRFVYNIRNKEAHYVSAGSAEIVYDNKEVGRVIAKDIIIQICSQLVNTSDNNILDQVNAWTTSEAVAIQEHNEDQLIDSILPKSAPSSVTICKDTTKDDIITHINSSAEDDYVINEVRGREIKKLEDVELQLNQKLAQILNSKNGIGDAKAFLESLLDNIQICNDEMIAEVEILRRNLANSINWDDEIKNLRTGIFGIFDNEAAEDLQKKVQNHIAEKRDLLRHQWAIQFFSDFGIYVNDKLEIVNLFKTRVESIIRNQRRDISSIQQIARSESQSQVFLHINEVTNINQINVDEMSILFRNGNPIDCLLNNDERTLSEILLGFANNQQSVVDAVNVSIEDKIEKMSDKELLAVFEKVKNLSSPLWSTNTYGQTIHAQTLTTIFTIGVYDRFNSVIQSKFKDVFTIGENIPTFATTNSTDRITFFQTQCYSPVYAVNNMCGYMEEATQKMNIEAYPVYYLDEKWHQRMISEGFDIMPRKEKDTILPNWVNAIIYGFIWYDEEKRTYCIKSRQGDSLFGDRLELGQRRDLAFDQFQLLGLDREIEDKLQQMITEKGRPAIDIIMKRVKDNLENYVAQYAKLSRNELDRILQNDKAYQMVRDLLTKEVNFIRSIEF